MNRQEITFENKKNLKVNEEIPRINKIIDEDINEIKSVVNNNSKIMATVKILSNETPMLTYINENGQEKVATDEMLYKNNSYAIAYLNQKQNISSGTSLILFDNFSITGDYFEFDSTINKIRVLKDCVALLSGKAFVDGSTGDGYISPGITVNGKYKNYKLERIINRDFTDASIPTVPIELKSGDLIGMSIEYASEGIPYLRNGMYATFVAVTKI